MHDIRHRPHMPVMQQRRSVLPPNTPQVSHIQPTSVIQQNFQHRQHDGTDELSSSDSSGSDSDDGGARGGAGGVNHAQAQLDAAAAASEDLLNSADDIGSNDDGAETFETGQFLTS